MRRRAFTLVELLVVIAIIGILIGLRLHIRAGVSHCDAEAAVAEHQYVIGHVPDCGDLADGDRQQPRQGRDDGPLVGVRVSDIEIIGLRTGRRCSSAERVLGILFALGALPLMTRLVPTNLPIAAAPAMWPEIRLAMLGASSMEHLRAPIRVAGDRDYPPLTYLEDGVAKGFSVDVIRALGKVLGRDLPIELMPWDAAQKRVQEGNAELLTDMSITEERKASWDFATPTITRSNSFVARRTRSS